jgi:hypothetical protein
MSFLTHLWDCARRAMNMNTTFLHDIFRGVMRQAQLVCMRLDPAQCDLHALLENVAKFSCQLHAATPGHVRNLDEKYATVAARAVGNEASHDSWATISCQQVLRGTLPENSTSLGAPARQKGPQGERRPRERVQRTYLVFSAISSSYFSIPRISSMSCTDS